VVKYHNESHVGPGEARPVGRGDRLVGEIDIPARGKLT
jgi:hypothetical protein